MKCIDLPGFGLTAAERSIVFSRKATNSDIQPHSAEAFAGVALPAFGAYELLAPKFPPLAPHFREIFRNN